MAMTGGARRRGAIAEINVTPMADVMIVLLIIFMVTVPLLDRPPVALPEAAHPVSHPEDRIEIVVRADGAITVGDTAFDSTPVLAEYLAARASLAGSVPLVLVQADRDAAYSALARALSACRAAGLVDVAIATDPAPGSDRSRS